MAKYTIELRHICEELAGETEPQGADSIDDILEKCWDKIFSTECEIFDDEYRKPLCKKILKHFYMREIGFETFGLFKFYLNKELEEQLPYFNQLYRSALLKFPIFNNFAIKTEHTNENTGETTDDTQTNETSGNETNTTGGKTIDGTQNVAYNDSGKKNTDSTAWNEHSDTPQGALSNIKSGYDSSDYLSDITKETNETEETASSESTTDTVYHEEQSYHENTVGSADREQIYGAIGSSHDLEEFVEFTRGKEGSETYAEMLIKFRETFRNIDMELIRKFEPLFMQLW